MRIIVRRALLVAAGGAGLWFTSSLLATSASADVLPGLSDPIPQVVAVVGQAASVLELPDATIVELPVLDGEPVRLEPVVAVVEAVVEPLAHTVAAVGGVVENIADTAIVVPVAAALDGVVDTVGTVGIGVPDVVEPLLPAVNTPIVDELAAVVEAVVEASVAAPETAVPQPMLAVTPIATSSAVAPTILQPAPELAAPAFPASVFLSALLATSVPGGPSELQFADSSGLVAALLDGLAPIVAGSEAWSAAAVAAGTDPLAPIENQPPSLPVSAPSSSSFSISVPSGAGQALGVLCAFLVAGWMLLGRRRDVVLGGLAALNPRPGSRPD